MGITGHEITANQRRKEVPVPFTNEGAGWRPLLYAKLPADDLVGGGKRNQPSGWLAGPCSPLGQALPTIRSTSSPPSSQRAINPVTNEDFPPRDRAQDKPRLRRKQAVKTRIRLSRI